MRRGDNEGVKEGGRSTHGGIVCLWVFGFLFFCFFRDFADLFKFLFLGLFEKGFGQKIK